MTRKRMVLDPMVSVRPFAAAPAFTPLSSISGLDTKPGWVLPSTTTEPLMAEDSAGWADGVDAAPGDVEADLIGAGVSIGAGDGRAQRAGAAVVDTGHHERRRRHAVFQHLEAEPWSRRGPPTRVTRARETDGRAEGG